MKLQGKRALITGATSGIGQAAAIRFAKEDCDLIVAGRNQEKLESLKRLIEKDYSVQVVSLRFDISNNKETVAALNSLSEENAKIDILVNNAGLVLGIDPISEINMSEVDTVIDTNIKGVLAVTRYFLPQFISSNSGHVVFLGSIAGHTAYEGGSVYCATKFAISAISRALKKELHGTKVRVTSIDPGAVETNFSNVRFRGDTKKAAAVYAGMESLQAEDIAETIHFACSQPEHVNISELVILATDQKSIL